MVDILKHYRKLVKAHRKAVSLSTNLDPEAKTNLPVATKAD